MSLSTFLLFLHVLSGFTLFAGVVLAATGFELARRRNVPGEIALALTLSRVGALLVMFSTVAVLSFGLLLVELRGYRATEGWILGAVVLLLMASVLGAVAGQRPKKARMLATTLADEGGGDPNGKLQELLGNRTDRVLNYASAGAIICILALMVFKP